MRSILVVGGSRPNRNSTIRQMLEAENIHELDTITLEAEPSIKIEQVRGLISFLQQKPIQNSYKAGVIFSAEKATTEAQNALLKVLEEPPKSAYILLSAPHPEQLLPTVVSRCRIIRLDSKAVPFGNSTDNIPVQHIFQLLVETEATAKQRLQKAFEYADRFGKDRNKAQQVLDMTILYVRERYLQAEDNDNTIGYAKLASRLKHSSTFISANVNPRQVLENLFLSTWGDVSIGH